MLTEMAGMSVDDGLTMQLHPGPSATTTRQIYQKFGRDKGADIPSPTEYVRALRPLLIEVRQRAELHIHPLHPRRDNLLARAGAAGRAIIPVCGWVRLVVPRLARGHDALPRAATETAGFYNTVGFNDDTRAFLSIPARHDVARRVDCAFLARLVAEHRLDEDEAFELIRTSP